MKVRNRSIVAAALAAGALLAAAPGAGAGSVTPATGIYSAEPAKLTNGVYTPGVFAVVSDGAKRRIVSGENYDGIYYPDQGKCDQFNVPLVTESIPISARGKFKVRERTPVRKGSVLVVWKGTWTKPKRVKGTLRISYGDCSSKIAWTGKRAAAAARP
ncbi:MAG: hypothetical protein U0R51_02445 [Solirubrobacterales bacterium]